MLVERWQVVGFTEQIFEFDNGVYRTMHLSNNWLSSISI